jgi:hypothetical protein
MIAANSIVLLLFTGLMIGCVLTTILLYQGW